MSLTDIEEQKLEETANKIRRLIIEMLVEAGSGHSAGPLGMADVFAAFYFHILNHKPDEPNWEDRDRLVLSNGHIAPVRYAAMAEAGYFPVDELKTLRKINSRLQGHPHRGSLPGLETTSGPLGSGLSQACGMALSAMLDKKKHRIYCFMSDGEQDAGNTWEAAMLAGKYGLDNLTGVIDRNNIQIDGFTENVMPLESLKEKYESFGWHVLEIDGHNFEQIVDAANEAKAIHDSPTLIIAHTIPGKGVSFMENDFNWHGKPPTREEADIALQELSLAEKRIKEESKND